MSKRRQKADFEKALAEIAGLESTVQSRLERDYSKKTQRRLKVALRKNGKVKKRLDGKITVSCRDEKRTCRTTVGSHTWPLVGRGFKVCRSWFAKSATSHAAIIVHELMHKTDCTDTQYWSTRNKPSESYTWHNIASTCDYWIIHGMCVPGDDC